MAQDRHADAVKHFLTPMGMPPEVIEQLSQDPAMLAHAPTILYDPFEVMSDRSRDGKTPAQQAGEVKVPALVLAGGASPQWMIDTGAQIAGALPKGQLDVLEDQGHVVPPHVLAPALTEFLLS